MNVDVDALDPNGIEYHEFYKSMSTRVVLRNEISRCGLDEYWISLEREAKRENSMLELESKKNDTGGLGMIFETLWKKFSKVG